MRNPEQEGFHTKGVGQCDACGGYGCLVCYNSGFVSETSKHARHCHNDDCDRVIPPGQIAVYCTTGCALSDA